MAAHKVERVIEEYGLAGVGETLEADWTGRDGERSSLRDLADDLNTRILRAALRDAGDETLARDAERLYERLADEDALAASKNEIRRRLSEAGVPIEAVESDFVSHQTVHTYLTDVRGASLEEIDDGEQVEKVRARVQRLRGRLEAVTRRELATLSNTDRIALGEFEVLSSVRVLCRTCDGDYEVGDLLRGDGCDCDELQT